ncbi:hypothetical protein, partial [Escherichia coli]|uniref:hypothetical protein n=1 Tax=Escherichia coli TaxID=562 RepID=UPI001BFEDAF9
VQAYALTAGGLVDITAAPYTHLTLPTTVRVKAPAGLWLFLTGYCGNFFSIPYPSLKLATNREVLSSSCTV